MTQMHIMPNAGAFPGVPEDLLIGRWTLPNAPSGRPWRLIAMGDIGLSGHIAVKAHRLGHASHIFRHVRPAIQAGDCSIGNLECALLERWSADKLFAGDAAWAGDLAEAGMDLLQVANGHMYDHGPEGYLECLQAVEDAGITIIGGGRTHQDATRLVVREAGPLRVGFLATCHSNRKQFETPRYWELDLPELTEAVERARSQVDILVVSLHWGTMLIDYPPPSYYHGAHQLVEAGASAVLMHHPHILQGVEIHSEGAICFSLGNFVFDPTEGLSQRSRGFTYIKYDEQMTSCLFSLEWVDGQFAGLSVAPIALPCPDDPDPDNCCLIWPQEDVARRVLERLQRISEDLLGDFGPMVRQQVRAIYRRELRINLRLILAGDLWRIGYLLRKAVRVFWRCLKALAAILP